MINNSNIIFQLLAAFMITISASIMVEVPKNIIIKNGIIGVIGQITYVLADAWYSKTVAVLISCFIVSMISQVAARKFKAPVTTFYIPVFFMFVPGQAIYQAAYFLIQEDKVRSGDALIEALNIAGAVALGVFLSDSLLEIYSTQKYRRIQQKKESHHEQPS